MDNDAFNDNIQNEIDVDNSNFKLVDAFRYFHPSLKEAFTCWNTKVGARHTNYGTRLDYTLCNSDFLLHCVNDANIHPDIQGSDHCPVSLEFSDKFSFISSKIIPNSCTKFYPEFCGNQQKLSCYFTKVVKNSNCEVQQEQLVFEIENNKDNCSLKRKFKKEDIENDNKGNCYPYKRASLESKVSGRQNASKQTTLNSFFTNKDNFKESSNLNDKGKETVETNSNLDEKSFSVKNSTLNNLENQKNQWNFLMKVPSPPPFCSGHQEPSVLRTTKKKGPNFNKKFYACARGVGKEGDPNARCNFFKWVSK